MFDVKFWEEIKTNYPKAYDECRKNFNISNNYMNDWKCLCFCDIETYFYNLGMIIIIDYDTEDNNYYYWIYRNQFNIEDTFEKFSDYKLRPEAKLAAVKKAFEIRENQLKDGK